MLIGIVTETCPAPECNLTKQDIEHFGDEMKDYPKNYESAFRRPEQLEQGKVYLNGLLSDLQRKNTERIALEMGENVRNLQHFVGQSPWEQEPLLTIHQRTIGEILGENDGVVLIDESSVAKQGEDSVAVASQYCGSVGKIANGQAGAIWDMPVAKATVWLMDSSSCQMNGLTMIIAISERYVVCHKI